MAVWMTFPAPQGTMPPSRYEPGKRQMVYVSKVFVKRRHTV